jgi:hypothetical protein
MKTLGLALLYFVIGFAEWFLATQRTWDISQAKPIKVAICAFFEEMLGIFVLVYVVIYNPDQWWLLVFGALGGAVGAYLNLKTPL